MSTLSTANIRVTVIGILFVLSMLVLGTYFLNQVAQKANKRIVDFELVLSLANLSARIDARVEQMKMISNTIANDEHIHAWVDKGFDNESEAVLINKLGFFVKEYNLTSASFADKTSHKYWNQEGFLRKLTPEIDTWYYAYLASGEQDLVSVYHDQNKHRVDLYVNYQQTNGNGLSGIATSFDGVLDMLNRSEFAEHGQVLLVDRQGSIQMRTAYPSPQVSLSSTPELSNSGQINANTKNLQAIVGDKIAKLALSPQTDPLTPFIGIKNHMLGSSYIPSMNWFVVVYVPKSAFVMSASD